MPAALACRTNKGRKIECGGVQESTVVHPVRPWGRLGSARTRCAGAANEARRCAGFMSYAAVMVGDMSTEITVRGSFSAFHPAERGTTHVAVAYEGPQMAPVYERVAHDLEVIKSSINPLHENGSVTWWSAEQLRTWSARPWNQDGEQLPLVHHAAVGVEVKFRDFAELSRWVSTGTSSIDGFRLQGVKWALTDKRREALIVETRTRAVRDAVTRAQQYADALGLGKVRPVSIADAGMLAAHIRPEGDGVTGSVRAGSAVAGGDVQLVPNQIELSAAVDARFVVGEDSVGRQSSF